MTARRIVSVVLTATMVLGNTVQPGSPPVMAQTAANANDQALDKLMGPIALYPDPLLAQVLACASSPQQVTEVSGWLKMQDKELQGSKLQEAATTNGFDASFAAIVLFPDVLSVAEVETSYRRAETQRLYAVSFRMVNPLSELIIKEMTAVAL